MTPAMFHWDSLGADMVAVAQPSCGNGFVVMGDSMGAAAALTAMAQEPGFRDQVRGLVLTADRPDLLFWGAVCEKKCCRDVQPQR